MDAKVLNNLILRSKNKGQIIVNLYVVYSVRMQFKVNNSHFYVPKYETIDFNFVTINLPRYILKLL